MGYEDEDIFDNIAQPEGKIGAKKLRKLQEKAEKKSAREVCKGEIGENMMTNSHSLINIFFAMN